MSRASDMEKRKALIIEATMDILYMQGFCDLRLIDVAQRAGVSAGLVCHHFKTKKGLLLAVMRYAVDIYQKQSEAVALEYDDATGRILALVQVALSVEQANARLSSVWLALYYLAASDPDYHTELQRYQHQNQENLLAPLSQIFHLDEARQKASLIAALIDGVWLQNAVQCETVDLDLAQKLAADLVENVLG